MLVEAAGEAYYTEVVGRAEEILKNSGVNHRFVGGAIANPIDLNTTVMVNVASKKAKLHFHKPLSLIREDGSTRDLDAIGFSPYPQAYREARIRLQEERKKAKERRLPYPPISIEPTCYPHWPERNRLLQFVSTIDVDEANRVHLIFGGVDQIVPWETMEPWTIKFKGLEITSINPYGIPIRYEMRCASGPKKKDHSKLGVLQGMADSVLEQGLAQEADYKTMYTSWRQFIDQLRNHPDPLTYFKAQVTRLYWNTVGTALAHGIGILQPAAHLGDKFTG